MDEARQHASEARLKLLETQLEPHMLFNTLANLRALIGTDPQRAQQMLDHMIDYLRATLGASLSPTHPLQAEFDRLRDYLELMGGRITVTARREGASLVLDVIDTGVGLADTISDSGTGTIGFGMAQVRERLASSHGPSFAIELVATYTDGTRACITFSSQP